MRTGGGEQHTAVLNRLEAEPRREVHLAHAVRSDDDEILAGGTKWPVLSLWISC